MKGKKDSPQFSIDSMGQLKTKVALDYETTVGFSYTVYVTATGSAGKKPVKVIAAVTIDVIDKQEPPMFDDEATTTPRIRPRDRYGRDITPAVSAIDPDSGDSVSIFP